MQILTSDTHPIRTSEDVTRIRQVVRACAVEIGLSLVDQTKLVTAASEIARNTLDYGLGGDVTVEVVLATLKKGVRLIFKDNGPGIADVPRALTDGYTTGSGLGLGLSGAKRLSNEFTIETAPGQGTTITLVRWKP